MDKVSSSKLGQVAGNPMADMGHRLVQVLVAAFEFQTFHSPTRFLQPSPIDPESLGRGPAVVRAMQDRHGDRLDLSSGQLFYRIWATDSSSEWVNAETSLDDDQAGSAPAIHLGQKFSQLGPFGK